MESLDNALLSEVIDYSSDILTNEKPQTLTYHNLQHTKNVVAAVEEIAKKEQVSDNDLQLLKTAAWFHDVGHCKVAKGHEEESVKIATDFLEKKGLTEEQLKVVSGMIMATKMPQTPLTELEKIICDADLLHLSNKDFFSTMESLREEWKAEENMEYTEEEWLKKNIHFIRSHSYFTQYGKDELESGKEKNIKKLEKKLKKLQKDKNDKLMKELDVDMDELKKLKKKLEKVEGRPERGIETMFRVTSRNHVDFSSMADSKANILISVNSIIITIIIGVLMRKLDNNPHLILPTFTLLVVCLSSIVFAILATRPNITSGLFTEADIKNKKANLLFFGNFHKMKLSDFEWGMTEMIQDGEYLYGSMIRDIYFLGAVLGKKYRFLRIAYTIFMFGLIISSIVFMIASISYTEKPTPSLDSLF